MKKFYFVLCALFVALGANAQTLSISTNIADYMAGGTLNMEASWGFARHWSVSAGGKYNPFAYGDAERGFQLKQRSFSAGARWWPWHIYSGWWMGARLRYQEFSEGGIWDGRTAEGDRYGGALTAGYSRMLGKHFNLDFGVGLWAGYSVYDVYACRTCGRRLESGRKAFLLPEEVLIGINYIF